MRGAAAAVYTAVLAGLAALAGLTGPGVQAAAAQDEAATNSGLVERAESRLVQLDLTVTGAPEIAGALQPEDFSIRINGDKLLEFGLDRMCDGSAATAAAEDGTSRVEPAAAARPMSLLFYFDQAHLTLPGRQRSIDLARELVQRLVRDGNRAMIVSNARRLALIQEFSDDPAQVLNGLSRLEHDRSQWDFYASEEDTRVTDVMRQLDDSRVSRAMSVARRYQREERWRSDKHLRRLSATLARLGESAPPKAVLYFADTMRSNAGEHYLTFFGERVRGEAVLDRIGTDSLTAGLAFDQTVNEASAHGIRFYPVRAEGLVVPFDLARQNQTGMDLTGAVSASPFLRHRNTQDSLSSLASETGGRAFLRGDSPRKIAERILEDFSCVYLVSFDPGDRPRNAPLRVRAELLRDGAELRSRGRIVVQSESRRLTSRLRSAFLLEGRGDFDLDVRAAVVPVGFDQGRYTALLQISVPGTALPAAVWDIGASIVFRDRVREEVAGRHRLQRPGVSVVLEREIHLEPGVHEVVSVAHESSTDMVLSDKLMLDWPDPDRERVSCSPVSLLQPTTATFVRGDEQRNRGSLARGSSETVDIARPAALVGLVCRSRRLTGPLTVERTLTGSAAVELPALNFELGRERCAQIRDVVPADTLQPGLYRYELRVRHEGTVAAQTRLDFLAD